MYPVICKIGPFTIFSYGLMLALAFLVGSYLAVARAKKDGLQPDIIFNFAFLVFISGIIGARIFYVVENAGYYLKNPLEIIMLQRGGLAWFGGLILGTLVGFTYLKSKNLSIYKVLDLIVPFVALGQAIGRIGCLLNGCCFGRTFFPVQAYSALILLVIFIILRFMQERPHKDGEIVCSYLMLYCLKRFYIESFRIDNAVIVLGLTLFQILSIVIFFLAFIKFILIRKSKT
ncbi:MAG: prolipoprotein diacylglyceryl transferase [Candidatus Omnitrophica bacterium]|nr:prolipoprotein diacylglyceryl transferase [Candidatus Omnitrophota bacterium]